MIYTKEEQAQIKAFIDNPVMSAAVFRVLLPDEEIAAGVPIQDDAEYGRAVKAWVGARDLVRARINDLKRMARNPQDKPRDDLR